MVVATARAPSAVVAPRNAASRGPSSSGRRDAHAPRSSRERRAWARASSSGVDISLTTVLPALQPWAEARVQKCSGAWKKAAALTKNPPIVMVDLVPESKDDEDSLSRIGTISQVFRIFRLMRVFKLAKSWHSLNYFIVTI